MVRVNLSYSVGSVALLSACSLLPYIPEPTPVQFPPILNSLEYAIQADEATTMAERLDDAVASANDAFANAAAITFNAAFVSNAPVNNQTWPNPDKTDPNYYGDNWPTWYQQFIQNNRDASRAFGVYFVTAPPYSNAICTGKKFLGVTTPDSKYNPNWSTGAPTAGMRGSLIFVALVDAFAQSCQGYQTPTIDKQTLLIHVLTHELGHQRAGLTHTDEQPQFHSGQGFGPTTPPRWDVMHSNPAAVCCELKYKTPIFDRLDGGPFTNSQTTCQDNLYQWRSITN